MSKQLTAVNNALQQIYSSLSTGNKHIETHLKALQTSVDRANGKGFWGSLSKAYDTLQGLFGKNFKSRDRLKKDLSRIANDIKDEAAETATLINKLVLLADSMPQTSAVFTDQCF